MGDDDGTADEPRSLPDVAGSVLEQIHAEALRTARQERFTFAALKWMYLVVFVVAVGMAVATVRIAGDVPATGFEWSQAGVAAAVGAVSVALFTLLVLARPLGALERHSVVQAYLAIVISSYWARVLGTEPDAGESVDGAVEAATEYAAEALAALLDRQYLRGARYLGLVEWAPEVGDETEQYRTPL